VSAPVLFIAFARPEQTLQTFARIRQAQPSALYVSIDAPRTDRGAAERALVDEVTEIATAVNWPCTLHTQFSDHNRGPGGGPRWALDWFMSQVSEGIIVEDDCLPEVSFFEFCDELLERYRDEPRVGAIAGTAFAAQRHPARASYRFSRYATMWGWATWRRAWAEVDPLLGDWPTDRGSDWLLQVGDGHRDFADYWTGVFDMVRADLPEYWDYQFQYALWKRGQLTIHPAVNLVSNIGFATGASHTHALGAHPMRELATAPMAFPLQHPPGIAADLDADRWIDLQVYRTRRSLRGRALRRAITALQSAGIRHPALTRLNDGQG
jgi:hypothetical protein